MRGAVGVAGSSVVCSERPERGGAVRATLRLHAQREKSDPAVPGIQNREWKLQREVELVLKRKLQSLIIDCISWTERPCENA